MNVRARHGVQVLDRLPGGARGAVFAARRGPEQLAARRLAELRGLS